MMSQPASAQHQTHDDYQSAIPLLDNDHTPKYIYRPESARQEVLGANESSKHVSLNSLEDAWRLLSY